MQRRDILINGSLLLMSLVTSAERGLCASARRHDPALGCLLTGHEARGFAESSVSSDRVILQSGDRAFDLALAQSLSRLSDIFGVHPSFLYYDDFDVQNAYATIERYAYGPDGTVLFGRRFLQNLLSRSDNPDLGVACVCAHEFGHILQYKRGLHHKLMIGQSTVKRVELQADFLAGYFAGIRKKERTGFPAAVFAVTQFSYGDDMVNYRNHHGTPDERAAAIIRGFNAAYRANLSIEEAVDDSTSFVTSLP